MPKKQHTSQPKTLQPQSDERKSFEPLVTPRGVAASAAKGRQGMLKELEEMKAKNPFAINKASE